MADYKEYKCKECGYSTYANPKGHDMMMMGDTQSFLCENCHEIVDILVSRYGEKMEEIVCPECGSKHIQKWNPVTGKCPKCGGKMKATGNQMFVD